MSVRNNLGTSARNFGKRLGTALAVGSLVVGAMVLVPSVAQADTTPAEGVAETVTTDALPTVQISGIVWDQVIVGRTVYAVGQFNTARPAGAPAGTGEVVRSNILAYDIETGEMLPFAPAVNGQVRTITASPDGKRIYIGGDFTAVDGASRQRLAAFYTADGRMLTSWTPSANASVRGIDATSSAVYITGAFGRVSSNTRAYAAAISSAGALLPWAPVLNDRGNDVLVSDDGSKVAIGGHFSKVNGSSNPGYGMALLDPTSAALLPFSANTKVRNAGPEAAIWSLHSDGPNLYAAGYSYASVGAGNLEGIVKTDWATGNLVWVEDCHGDSYGVFASKGAVYAASHAHYCGSLENGFPDSNPTSYFRGTAFSESVARITPSGLGAGYFDWGGTPAPSLLHWFPTFDTGKVSGSSQAAWTVTGNDDYVLMGGEFTKVNGQIQQGLVRFARTDKAPNTDGPRLGGSKWVPTATSSMAGSVRITWPVNWDRDNEMLEYKVIRDGVNGSPVYVTTASSKPEIFGQPAMSFLDTGLVQGSTHTYRLRVEDPHGNVAWSSTVTATVNGSQAMTDYSSAILKDAPSSYWPLNDTGSTSLDFAGTNNLNVYGGVTRNVAGALTPSSIPASAFNGRTNGFASTRSAQVGPQKFAIETWFKTTSTAGGKIIGFGNRATGTSTTNDRNVYMDTSGRVNFGVYTSAQQVLTSPGALNDGNWHHVVASVDPTQGQQLYIDGVKVAQRQDVTSAENSTGYWRVGGDVTWSGAQYFNGSIDEVAIYPGALDREQIRDHYRASGRSYTKTAPADVYGASVYASEPTLYWRLGEAAGTVAADSGAVGVRGTYSANHTKGVAGALKGVGDTAVTFTDAQVISQNAFTNPTVYSTEAWFKSTSTAGGKILGFGNSGVGNSTFYDRHIYMRDTGAISFGVNAGGQTELTTSARYNDGRWHHVVATQGAEGMRLYVDGIEAGRNATNWAQNYTGYWHVGGDWAWGGGGRQFIGQIDEVAVYPTVLSAKMAADHYALGSAGALPNVLPTASFTMAADKTSVAVDAAASADEDGSIAEYRWNWGDGSAESVGVAATHAYTNAGGYTVTLTVTDDRGGVTVTTQQVSVVANQAPTAVFTATTAGFVVNTDSSASIDPDGEIVSRTWNWGDGTAEEEGGAQVSHAYTAAGTYTVTLKVTDTNNAVSSTSQTVVVAAPVEAVVLATDAFERTLPVGLGAADVGGAWSLLNSTSSFSTDGAGRFVLSSGGSQRGAYLSDVVSANTDLGVDVSVEALPVGGSVFAQALVRRVGADDYRGRVTVAASGAATLQILRGGTSLGSVSLKGVTVTPGMVLRMRVEALGVNPTTLNAKAWDVSGAEPEGWQLTRTDETAALQVPGQVGLVAYAGGGVSNTPFVVRFDNVRAVQPGTGVVTPEPQPEVPQPEDPQPEVPQPEDPQPEVPQPEDPQPEPAGGPLVVDEFDRAVTAGWGAAATGGDWSFSTSAVSAYSVDGNAANISVAAGSTRMAYLAGVSSVSTSLVSSLQVTEAPVGGSVFGSFIARRVGVDDYRARVVVAANGGVQVQLQRTDTTLKAVNVAGVTLGQGEELQVRVEVFGTNPTTIRAKVWKVGAAEPADWQVSVTDATAVLQAPGHVGVGAYVGSGVTNVPYVVRFGSLTVGPVL